MDKLQLPNAKLLFLVTELYKEKLITETQKIDFKSIVPLPWSTNPF